MRVLASIAMALAMPVLGQDPPVSVKVYALHRMLDSS